MILRSQSFSFVTEVMNKVYRFENGLKCSISKGEVDVGGLITDGKLSVHQDGFLSTLTNHPSLANWQLKPITSEAKWSIKAKPHIRRTHPKNSPQPPHQQPPLKKTWGYELSKSMIRTHGLKVSLNKNPTVSETIKNSFKYWSERPLNSKSTGYIEELQPFNIYR